ncbi:MAG: bacillithiol biosynthesis cysteine-adding enzyme BshC [Bacteroidetes bacterium]|nr:bacillithiol biosynthesis cysteine-adding enzyme BshC [Bacteroidota bacterium]
MLLEKTGIPFKKNTSFTPLFLDYVNGADHLRPFYEQMPTQEGIFSFVAQNPYPNLDRVLLHNELLNQNKNVQLSDASKKNIDVLKNKNTYTVTTGHQLCLATGPLYFIYKILSCINLCEILNKKNTHQHFVPVYWLASEDHDFEEINHLHLFGKKIVWQSNQKGKVGSFSLHELHSTLAEMQQVLGTTKQAQELFDLLQHAYSRSNLTEATRYLVNELFGNYGLVIVDGDSNVFKPLFIPEIKKDVFENTSYQQVNKSTSALQQHLYNTQVSPREINVFYTDTHIRERIVQEGGTYKVLNTPLAFSKQEMQNLIEASPEKISPNVVLRPLYQQKILPNAVYVGGPGELAYWLQYQALFQAYSIPFPVLVPRNFIFYLEKNTAQKIEKLGLKPEDFFEEKDKIIKKYLLLQQPFSLQETKELLKKGYNQLKQEIGALDKTLIAAAEAEEQKNSKGIEALEQKGIKALKQKNEQAIKQIETVYERLFPQHIPQERYGNFLQLALTNPSFIEDIKNNSSSFVLEKEVLLLSEK